MTADSSDTPFREPAAPKRIKRILPSRRFGSAYVKAQTEASVVTARAWASSTMAIVLLGIVSYFTLPPFLGHFGQDSHAGACLCKALPLAFILIAATVIPIAVILKSVAKAKPLRQTFQRGEDAIMMLRAFNNECTRINIRIRKFEMATPRKKKEIVAEALRISQRRQNVIHLMESFNV